MSIILEFTIDGDAFPLGEALSPPPEMHIELERIVHDDMDSDGALLAGPQPSAGDKREFPRCVTGSLRVRVGIEGH